MHFIMPVRAIEVKETIINLKDLLSRPSHLVGTQKAAYMDKYPLNCLQSWSKGFQVIQSSSQLAIEQFLENGLRFPFACVLVPLVHTQCEAKNNCCTNHCLLRLC